MTPNTVMPDSPLPPSLVPEPTRNFKKGDKLWHKELGYVTFERLLNSSPAFGFVEKGKQGLQKVKVDDLLLVKGEGTGPKKLPGYLSAEKLEWDNEGRLAHALGYFCGSGNIRFYLHLPEHQLEPVINKYHDLTGQILEPRPGLLTVVPTGEKWGLQVEIRFTPTNSLPDQLAGRENRPGVIRSGSGEGGLFWALIEHGFFIQGPQNPEKVRAFVPADQRQYFDQGLSSES